MGLALSRRMTRNFLPDPVDPDLLTTLLDVARRSPSAGNTAAAEFLVLEGPEQVARYWEVTLPQERRASFPWPGLLLAPVLVVLWTNPEAYVERYAQPDKQRTGLGDGTTAWSTPYWYVDGGMAAMSLLLGVEEAGLGALFFGVFDHEQAVREQFGVPGTHKAVGAVALGHPAPKQRKSTSAGRSRAPLDQRIHRERW